MTSEAQANECFVYITLPGETKPVTAGKLQHTIDHRGDAIGRFVYGKSYLSLSSAVPFDPVELKLIEKTFETTRLKGVFGALRDAGPDFWGRRLIERHVGRSNLNELDYLLHSPDDRAGALGFGLNSTPPAPKHQFNQTLDLQKLQAIALAMAAEQDLPTDGSTVQMSELLLLGTSMGGARPKAVIENAGALWLAKFNRPDDRWNNARVEHAMLLLGRACGLTTAESEVVSVAGRDVLLVKRFDREKTNDGYFRSRMVSALTLLQADESAHGRDQWSYVSLVEELRRVSAEPQKDARELFRRMCFNALISNIDDHPRNHAIIAKNKTWKLSPAYDLTPSIPISADRRDLAMSVGNAGRYANKYNLLSQSARFLLSTEEASKLIHAMEEQVRSTWHRIARRAGVAESDCSVIQTAFVYPGFNLPQSAK